MESKEWFEEFGELKKGNFRADKARQGKETALLEHHCRLIALIV
jgi:hypothetical protein